MWKKLGTHIYKTQCVEQLPHENIYSMFVWHTGALYIESHRYIYEINACLTFNLVWFPPPEICYALASDNLTKISQKISFRFMWPRLCCRKTNCGLVCVISPHVLSLTVMGLAVVELLSTYFEVNLTVDGIRIWVVCPESASQGNCAQKCGSYYLVMIICFFELTGELCSLKQSTSYYYIYSVNND